MRTLRTTLSECHSNTLLSVSHRLRRGPQEFLTCYLQSVVGSSGHLVSASLSLEQSARIVSCVLVKIPVFDTGILLTSPLPGTGVLIDSSLRRVTVNFPRCLSGTIFYEDRVVPSLTGDRLQNGGFS